MICKAVLLINLTVIPWTPRDFKSMITAQNTCKERYNTCLATLVKVEEHTFRARCGMRRVKDVR